MPVGCLPQCPMGLFLMAIVLPSEQALQDTDNLPAVKYSETQILYVGRNRLKVNVQSRKLEFLKTLKLNTLVPSYSAMSHVAPMTICEQELPVVQYFDLLPLLIYTTNCGEQTVPLYRCFSVQ